MRSQSQTEKEAARRGPSLSVRIAVAFAQSACGATAAAAVARIICSLRAELVGPLSLSHLARQSLSLRRNQSAGCQGASQIMQIRLGERGHPAKLNYAQRFFQTSSGPLAFLQQIFHSCAGNLKGKGKNAMAMALTRI
jgi:hypothetical protein